MGNGHRWYLPLPTFGGKGANSAVAAAKAGGNVSMSGPEGTLWGIFRSLDEGQTWEKISGLYPMGVSKGNSVLAADPGIYGRVYIGTSGIGYFYSDLSK